MALINLQTLQKPKINVTNIKSPIGKLNGGVGSFRPLRMISSLFSKRRIGSGNLGESPTQSTSIDETLLETNRILVEIQNQLAIDFANRITKETEEIKKIRRTSDRKRRIDAEDKIESKNIQSNIGKTFDKVVSPIKGIFGRLLGFFGWIGAGFLANKAISWLSKNTEKVGKFFDVVANNWQLITGVVVGGLLVNVARKLAFAYRVVRSIFGIRGLRGVTRGGGQAAVRSISRMITQGHDSASSIARSTITKGRPLSKGISPIVGQLTSRGLVQVGSRGGSKIFRMGDKALPFTASLGRAPGVPQVTRTTSNVIRRLISSSPNIRGGISKVAARVGSRKGPKITGDVLRSTSRSTRLGRVGQKVGTRLGSTGAGAIPLIGNFWDLGAASYRFSQGDNVGGLLSLLSAIPVLGWGAAAIDVSREFGAFDGSLLGRKGISENELANLSPSQINNRLKGSLVVNQGTGAEPDLKVLPPFDAGMTEGEADAAAALAPPPAGGDSIPFVSAIDLANPWIERSQETLGILV